VRALLHTEIDHLVLLNTVMFSSSFLDSISFSEKFQLHKASSITKYFHQWPGDSEENHEILYLCRDRKSRAYWVVKPYNSEKPEVSEEYAASISTQDHHHFSFSFSSSIPVAPIWSIRYP
jgi:hypothetical protein